MGRLLSVFLAVFMVMTVHSCKKDNQAAKDLDGVWTLTSWSYAGKDSISAGELTAYLGAFSFSGCKSASTDCTGSQIGFLGGVVNESFKWYFRNKAKYWTIGEGSLDSIPGVDVLAGEWDVISQSEFKFVVSSSSCINCLLWGKSVLEFSKQ